MTVAFRKGQYGVRVAQSAADLTACQALRHLSFYGRPGRDADPLDAACQHVMIANDAGLQATFRLMLLPAASDIEKSYAARFYDLQKLMFYPGTLMEMGRFCVRGGRLDPDILRVAWGAIAQIVDDSDVRLIFGCSSFSGVSPKPYGAAFAQLMKLAQAPTEWAPGVRAAETTSLLDASPQTGRAPMPPVLRSYLGMGGWVSDHAVIDRDLQTLHVFTGLEVDRIPPARAAALRAVAQQI